MNIIVFIVLLDDNVGISVVEFSVELRVLAHRLKLLNSINLNWVLSCLGKEGLSLSLQGFDLCI